MLYVGYLYKGISFWDRNAIKMMENIPKISQKQKSVSDFAWKNSQKNIAMYSIVKGVGL